MRSVILVVDDEEEIRTLTAQRLRRYGYTVKQAVDGEDALAKIAEERPDLILLDIIMPKKDGLDVLKELKRTEETRRIPVVMLSAKGELPYLEQGDKEGAIDYFIKPCDWAELLRYIKRYLP